MNKDAENEFTRNLNLNNVKVSLDVYCLMLPNNDYEYDCDVDDDEEEEEEDNNVDTYYQPSSSDRIHFPITSNSGLVKITPVIITFFYYYFFLITFMTYRILRNENPFLYLSYSIPSRHAQGLAAFIAEVKLELY